MSKNKKHSTTGGSIRASPKNAVAVTTTNMWQEIMGLGYRPLYECPEVRMCVNAYADLISNMTIHLMKNTDKGDVRVKNALSRRLDVEPCQNMTRKAWVWNIVNILLTVGDGNAVVYPQYSREGYLEQLIPLNPTEVSFCEPGDGYVIRYRGEVFRPNEVLHFTINPDPARPWLGTGFRVGLRDVVSSIRQAGATKKALLESPAPSLIVAVNGFTDDLDTPEGRDRMADKYLRVTEAGKPWIVSSELMTLQQVRPLTMSDLAIKDNLELDKRTIAGIMSVPPYMVGLGNYDKNAHENFINTQLAGIAQSIQQVLTRGLIYSDEMYLKFNPRSLYNYSLSELISAGKEMVDRMAMTRNEWRDWTGLAPREDMEEVLALENYIPVNKLGDQKKLKRLGGD